MRWLLAFLLYTTVFHPSLLLLPTFCARAFVVFFLLFFLALYTLPYCITRAAFVATSGTGICIALLRTAVLASRGPSRETGTHVWCGLGLG